MKKLTAALALLLCTLALVHAQQGVDTDELKSGAKKVEFVNFTGTHAVVETAEQIRDIGRGLAAGVTAGQVPARWLTKYSVFHVPSVAGQKAFGADIFTIDPDARIDHIDNVRRVVSAYLERLYGYPRRDADLLALFVSYYNAVNRGDLPYFSSRYLPAVTARLDAAKVGISTKYFEWPGTTQLVVPISAAAGRDILGALDASELTSAAVTDLLKAREDKGVADRTAAADLKEREAEAARKALADEQARLEAQRKATAEQEAAARAAAAEAERARLAGESEAAAKAAEAQRQADALAAQQAADKAAAEKLAAEQQAVAEREAELAAERADIARDAAAVEAAKTPEERAAELAAREAEVAAREEAARRGESDASILGGRLYYLKIKDYLSGGHYNNDMLIINAATGALVLRSEEADICGREFDLCPTGVVVISHKGNHQLGHYLVLLDLEDLSRKAVGEDPVFYRSFVEIREDFIYAVINAADGYYLGKFNLDMRRVAISKERVDGDSFISFYNDLVYINREDKQILVLDRGDLSTKSVINP